MNEDTLDVPARRPHHAGIPCTVPQPWRETVHQKAINLSFLQCLDIPHLITVLWLPIIYVICCGLWEWLISYLSTEKFHLIINAILEVREGYGSIHESRTMKTSNKYILPNERERLTEDMTIITTWPINRKYAQWRNDRRKWEEEYIQLCNRETIAFWRRERSVEMTSLISAEKREGTTQYQYQHILWNDQNIPSSIYWSIWWKVKNEEN